MPIAIGVARPIPGGDVGRRLVLLVIVLTSEELVLGVLIGGEFGKGLPPEIARPLLVKFAI
jgi:hypothetical protein